MYCKVLIQFYKKNILVTLFFKSTYTVQIRPQVYSSPILFQNRWQEWMGMELDKVKDWGAW